MAASGSDPGHHQGGLSTASEESVTVDIRA